MSLSRRQFTQLSLAAALATVAAPSFAGSAERTGSLSGRQGYKVSGTVKVKKVDGKTKVVLGDDYLFDPSKNPPDIKIGFGNGGKYAKGSKIHDALTVKKGAATFEVPASIDTDKYNELYIYCEQFTVILAVAPLS
ncbi:DM13 domain-containing protein [uncultured Tateyamaria sp.]|uniref:DM13 domain-containing protein n=1 Tax=uncultured Tateyamaria sp. TaxID=455651 RepID=UPI002604AAEF|nr:DM13 domain-containing protein [uncultured Tateyamaria sp.]